MRDGDLIEFDVRARRIHLRVSDEELARRRDLEAPGGQIRPRLQEAFCGETTQAHEGVTSVPPPRPADARAGHLLTPARMPHHTLAPVPHTVRHRSAPSGTRS